MLRTATLITEITEVPREWVFEHYLQLGQSLVGQDVTIKSKFNANDKEPSMFIFRQAGTYYYKDFSSGIGGDCIDLVEKLFNLEGRGAATHKIIADYNQYLNSNPQAQLKREMTETSRFQVEEHIVRGWIYNDQQYWSQYKIGSRELEFYNIKPLKSYTLRKRIDGKVIREITIDTIRIYGFFKEDGTLYKIYQPMRPKNKFVKIESYIQGSEQLTYNKEFLVICSSLKDMICLKKLGFKNIESVAPDSENVLIEKEVIDMYKEKYTNVCTILDHDEAGIKAMKAYKETYGIRGIKIPFEKDIADMVKEHGVVNTRMHLGSLLTKILRK